MTTYFEVWPKCPKCGGLHFERRPFVSEDSICLDCGYVSKAAGGERWPVNQPAENESESVLHLLN